MFILYVVCVISLTVAQQLLGQLAPHSDAKLAMIDLSAIAEASGKGEEGRGMELKAELAIFAAT